MKNTNVSQSFFVGSILAMVGGFLDSYTYLSRGHVFANAQTGNIVLFGLGLVNKNIVKALYYFVPIMSFVLGVIAAEFIRNKFKGKFQLHWRQIVILFEAITLFCVAFIPIDMAANCLVSFVCSLQVESFRKLHGNPFATTMCTGNLRSGTENLFFGILKKDKTHVKHSVEYFLIILFFICGAGIGALATDLFYQKAVIICSFVLVFVYFWLHPKFKE